LNTNSAGFTLIEALIVGLIMTILAAVSIPLYSGYVKDQERAAAISLAQTAAVSANSFLRRNGRVPTDAELNQMIFLPDPSRYTISVNITLTMPPDTNVQVVLRSDELIIGTASFGR
jgi:Tfp pilus assembly protein PilE